MKRRNFFKAMIAAPIVFGGVKRVIGAPAEPEVQLQQPGSPKFGSGFGSPKFGSGFDGHYTYSSGNSFCSGL